jgi:2-oxoglutarate ferredoxin oxidoreductase subunit beta
LVTGLIYMDRHAGDLHANLNTSDTPLNTMSEKTLCPGSKALDGFNASHR